MSGADDVGKVQGRAKQRTGNKAELDRVREPANFRGCEMPFN
jgi:hypothetical protein